MSKLKRAASSRNAAKGCATTHKKRYAKIAKELVSFASCAPQPLSEIPATKKRVAIWQCKKGHFWTATVASRFPDGGDCPTCELISKLCPATSPRRYNELSREFVATVDGDSELSAFPASSDVAAIWKCDRGHHWTGEIADRFDWKPADGIECTHCHALLVNRAPDLADTWDTRKNKMPLESIRISDRRQLYWLCPEGHSVQRTIQTRLRKPSECEECVEQGYLRRTRGVSKTHNFAKAYPGLVKEWDYDLNDGPPESYSPRSPSTVHWVCERGHKWAAQITSRTRKKHPNTCDVCKTLAYTHPEVASELHPTLNGPQVDAFSLRMSNADPVYWLCSRGHTFTASPQDRTRAKYAMSCNRCKSLAAVYPEQVLTEWDFSKNTVDPWSIRPSAPDAVHWRTADGPKVLAVTNRVRRWREAKTYEPWNRESRRPGSIVAVFPDEVMLDWDFERNPGVDPSMFTATSTKVVNWKTGAPSSIRKRAREWGRRQGKPAKASTARTVKKAG